MLEAFTAKRVGLSSAPEWSGMTAKSAAMVALLGALPLSAAAQSVASRLQDDCNRGELQSCNVLGLIFETGAAGVRDLARAASLYQLACDRGVEAGCVRLAIVQDGADEVAVENGFVRIGRVADANTGAPIPDAVVEVPALSLRAISDASGRVDLGRLPRGRHRMSIRGAGYEGLGGDLPVPWDMEFLVLMYRTAMPDPDAPGRIFGRVTEEGVGGGIADVDVAIVGPSEARTPSNPEGRFALAGLEPGPVRLQFTRLGYAPRTATIVVQAGTTVELYVTMATEAIELAPIEVIAGSAYLERTGFYQRVGSATGSRFTRRDVEAINPILMSDLLRRAPGVAVGQGRTRAELLSRRRSAVAGEPCLLRAYLDGMAMIEWDVDLIRPDDLAAVEVYQGLGVPIEYRNRADPDGEYPCGVVLIWTRR
jgi:hypothetical protein